MTRLVVRQRSSRSSCAINGTSSLPAQRRQPASPSSRRRGVRRAGRPRGATQRASRFPARRQGTQRGRPAPDQPRADLPGADPPAAGGRRRIATPCVVASTNSAEGGVLAAPSSAVLAVVGSPPAASSSNSQGTGDFIPAANQPTASGPAHVGHHQMDLPVPRTRPEGSITGASAAIHRSCALRRGTYQPAPARPGQAETHSSGTGRRTCTDDLSLSFGHRRIIHQYNGAGCRWNPSRSAPPPASALTGRRDQHAGKSRNGCEGQQREDHHQGFMPMRSPDQARRQPRLSTSWPTPYTTPPAAGPYQLAKHAGQQRQHPRARP